ncbi:MAG: hypothetical protein ACYTHJ_13605 [Planctomycetota bacterium]
MSSFTHRWQFLKNYISAPTCVGAVSPSSQALAKALCLPYRTHGGPARILEVGAGTGPVTSYLSTILGTKDELHVCEIQDDFADILENKVITPRNFGTAIQEGRVKLLRMPVQDIECDHYYDFIISGLPLTAFELRLVRDVFNVYRRAIKPNGVVSYFEYMVLRRARSVMAFGRKGKRQKIHNAYLSRNIAKHQFERNLVWRNFPPAYARHLRFDEFGKPTKWDAPYRSEQALSRSN